MIFALDRFQYSLFVINILLVRLRVILRRQPLSRTQSRTLISRPSRVRSIYNFRTQPFPIFVIYPEYASRAISRDSETESLFLREMPYANISALPGALLL